MSYRDHPRDKPLYSIPDSPFRLRGWKLLKRKKAGPLRVLHLIDGLGGGGSERNVWDIVRLSKPNEVRFRVATILPDDGSYVYAERLRQVGAFGLRNSAVDEASTRIPETFQRRTIRSLIPSTVKRPLRPLWHFARKAFSPTSQNRSSPKCGDLMKFEPNELSKWPADSIRRCLPRWFHGIIAESVWQRVLEEYLEFEPDVIHGHTFHGLAVGLYLKSIFDKPLVYSIPGLFSQLEDAEVGWLPEVYSLFHPWVDRFFTAYPGELLRIGVPAEKILALSGIVDLQIVTRTKSGREQHRLEIRRGLGIAEDTTIALSVGRLHPSKGHQYALEALPSLIRKLPNLHWVVLGINWEEERAKLENKAATLGVSDHVHIVGFVPDPLPFYAAADIYLRTLVFEGDNLSSFQAMAMGLPVIGFDTQKETELISKVKHGILVPPRDAAAIASAVQGVLLLPDRGRSMGERGVEYSRMHLDVQSLVSLLLSVYLDLHQSESK